MSPAAGGSVCRAWDGRGGEGRDKGTGVSERDVLQIGLS